MKNIEVPLRGGPQTFENEEVVKKKEADRDKVLERKFRHPCG